ncbi:cytochrome c-type biogenesis protein CcmH [Thiohalobacter sp. IOR34]|uniref:cytochrome c-type biogenesis protein n=1 Tax=Thiohalobacter sp. IOR34 TaxID=3057176 RepID=UPI0025B0E9C3|nr:cytochrome c-type biogenesis protein [Thiohalobacter sp. IOR34]WJW76494.1 cytochrome c-type biogenesis protein CcmH [Thiohalobacter sp. IOR34]
MRALLGSLFLILMLSAGLARAAIEIHSFNDPAEEARYRQLISELRCLVCQNQNLAESNADLARDLRQQTYEMIEQGKSDEEIIDYMVNRYGDFVLYRPPFKSTTLLLWLGPFLLFAVGFLVMLGVVRKRARAAGPSLDEAARQRARELLGEGEEKESKPS